MEMCLDAAASLPKSYPVRVFAVAVDKKGLIIAGAGNSYVKTHTKQAKWACFVKQPERNFLHAEVYTLIKAAKSDRTIDKLYVGRVDKQGNPKDGKPCAVCQAMLDFEFPNVEIIWSREK